MRASVLLRGLCALRDRVEAGRLQQLDPPLLGPIDRRRTERSVVVMDARAPQEHRLPVDAQAAHRVER